MSRIELTLRELKRWDEVLCVRCNSALRYATLLRVLQTVSWLGNGIFWYALMLALLVFHQADAVRPVLHMALVGAAGALSYRMLKRGTLRPRPYQVLQVAAGAPALDAFSLPSGHTLHAVAFTLVACAYYPALALVLVPFAAVTAASRVVLGLHYPSDVMAGAALGAAIAAASFQL